MPLHIFLYILSFVGIWLGAGLIISSVEKFSHRLRISSFSVSFLILGLLTSLGEISVGINSVLDRDPEIFVGTLIGATIVIFMLVIPLLAITAKNVKINPEFQKFNLISSLVVISLPVILSIDGKVDKLDGLIALILFSISVLMIELKRGILKKPSSIIHHHNLRAGKELLKIALGVGVICFSSNTVVTQTMYFSDVLNLSPFFISLMVVAIGTNLPELALVLRSMFFKDKEVAFGDYVGSAAYNTFIFGALTLWYGETIILTNSYFISLIFLLLGLLLFYIFAKSKNTLSRKEGFGLLFLYILFVGFEILVQLV